MPEEIEAGSDTSTLPLSGPADGIQLYAVPWGVTWPCLKQGSQIRGGCSRGLRGGQHCLSYSRLRQNPLFLRRCHGCDPLRATGGQKNVSQGRVFCDSRINWSGCVSGNSYPTAISRVLPPKPRGAFQQVSAAFDFDQLSPSNAWISWHIQELPKLFY